MLREPGRCPRMDERLLEKLEELRHASDEILEQMADPDVMTDRQRYQEIMIRHGELKPVVETFARYQEAEAEAEEAEQLAGYEEDGEMRDYFQTIAKERREELEHLDLDLRRLCEQFAEVHLVDLDESALEHGVGRQDASCCHLHAPETSTGACR